MRVVVGIGGVAAGALDGALVPHLFVSAEAAEDAHWLARTYSPFRARLGRNELLFQGSGQNRPSPVERRMIAEWTRRVAAEQAGGREGEPYGLALSWHRGASAESCESVSVFLSGEARARACAWSDWSRGRLQPAALARVYDWFDSLNAFQATELPEDAGEAEPSRLVFAGRGEKAPREAEQNAIEAFAAALFRELSARRRGGIPAPLPAETPAGTGLLLPLPSPRTSPPLARLAPQLPPPLPRTSASSRNTSPAPPQ